MARRIWPIRLAIVLRAAAEALLLLVLWPATSWAVVSEAEVRAYLKRQPDLLSYQAAFQPMQEALKQGPPNAKLGERIEEVARRLGVSRPVADSAVELMVLAKLTEFGRVPPELRRRMERARVVLLAGAGESRPAWNVLLASINDPLGIECADPEIEAAYFGHTWAAAELVEHGHACVAWLWDLPQYVAPTPALYDRLAELWPSQRSALDQLVASRAARDEMARRGPGLGSGAGRDVVRRYWAALAELGLWHDILADGMALSGDELEALLGQSSPPDGPERSCTASGEASPIAAARTAWLLAQLSAGREDEARAWRRRWQEPSTPIATGSHWGESSGEGPEDGLKLRCLPRQWLALEPAVDPFESYIDFRQFERDGFDWPGVRSLVTGYLERGGYPELAADVRSRPCRELEDSASHWSRFPAEVRASYAEYRERILAAEHDATLCAPKDGDAWPGTRRVADEYAVHVLPADLVWKGARPDAPAMPDAVRRSLRAPIVRYSAEGDLTAAISLSHAVDPTGEFGGGGYWLHLSSDRGHTWREPLYLGMQQFEPYVVVPRSKLPLVRDGRVQIEVEVREVDPETITFPPVMTQFKRTADNLVVEIPLADLERDSDGDGVPDLLEAHLLTNPNDPDTDHDGFADDIDPLPGVPATRGSTADPELVGLILESVMGYDRGAIRLDPEPATEVGSALSLARAAGVDRAGARKRGPLVANTLFVQTDPGLLRGVSLPGRLIVVSRAEVQWIRKRFGVFYPMSLPVVVNHARTRAYVAWSAGWIGGTLRFVKRDGHWRPGARTDWIT